MDTEGTATVLHVIVMVTIAVGVMHAEVLVHLLVALETISTKEVGGGTITCNGDSGCCFSNCGC